MHISGENVKLEVLLAKVQEDLNLLISKSSLRTLLLQNGVRFRKINARKICWEKHKANELCFTYCTVLTRAVQCLVCIVSFIHER